MQRLSALASTKITLSGSNVSQPWMNPGITGGWTKSPAGAHPKSVPSASLGKAQPSVCFKDSSEILMGSQGSELLMSVFTK